MRCVAGDSYWRHRHNPVRMPGCAPAPRRHCRRRTCFLLPDPRRPDWSETLARKRFAFRPTVRFFAPQPAIPHFGSVRARVRPLGLCRPRRPANPVPPGRPRTTSAQSRGRHNRRSGCRPKANRPRRIGCRTTTHTPCQLRESPVDEPYTPWVELTGYSGRLSPSTCGLVGRPDRRFGPPM